MICTEEEAKTKWCPHVRYGYAWDGGGSWAHSYNRTEDPNQMNCIGSQCMMFRALRRGALGYDRNPDDIAGYYCGLGGKP